MRVKRNSYRILLGKSEGKSILGSPGHREEVKVKQSLHRPGQVLGVPGS
jgi:hypothetical protein